MKIPTFTKLKVINKNIVTLSLVSLFTDMASEMLYPVMPLFLSHIGYSVLFIGILEGFAEAIAGISKGYFGKFSDMSGQRLPFVRFGYACSAISKPMMAVLSTPLWIFLSRTIDRLGKGIRTGARDAFLSEQTLPETKAKVFGFHRAMDTFGAVLGPLIAIFYLRANPDDYYNMFLLAFLPGIIAVALTFTLKERYRSKTKIRRQPGLSKFLKYWKESPADYKKLVLGLLVFALFNSSDVFLLLRMKETGMSNTAVIGIYVFYNFIYALSAYPLGGMADKRGFKLIFVVGLVLFCLVYTGFAFFDHPYIFLGLFAVYGIYAAATESIAKAWISNIVPERQVATAIGTFSGMQSICSLLASSLCGFIWLKGGSAMSFYITSAVTLLIIIYMSITKISTQLQTGDAFNITSEV